MDLRALTRTVQEQLLAGAAVGDEPTRQAAQLLTVSLEPALRLALQDAVAQVASEVSAGIAPGRVELGLRGGEVEVRVLPPEVPSARSALAAPPAPPIPPAPPAPAEGEDPAADSTAARVTFRPPQQLKARLEQAAAEQDLSLNAYLVRALRTHLDAGTDQRSSTPGSSSTTGRTSGWFL